MPLSTGCTHRGNASGCLAVEVTCPGLPARVVELNISERAAGTADKGTVVLGSGSSGTAFSLAATYGAELRTGLTSAGFRVVDRSWPAPTGWYGDHALGIRASGCRYATLVAWLRSTYHQAGGFCVAGNSGGAAELGYALTAWGSESVIDLAIPSGGPAVTRLDYACGSQANQTWIDRCGANIPNGLFACATSNGKPPCFLPARQDVCTRTSETPTEAQLRMDSVMFEGADVSYARTKLHFLNGTADCGATLPNGMEWANAITSEKSVEWVSGMPHPILTSAVGKDALLRTITNQCVSRR